MRGVFCETYFLRFCKKIDLNYNVDYNKYDR